MTERMSSDLASLKIAREEKNPDAGKSWRGWVIAGVLLLAVVAGTVLVLRSLKGSLVASEVEVTEIRFISPAQGSVQVSSTGYVVAQSTSKVGAKILGRVSEVRIKEGSIVKAGDVLIQLETAEQRAQVASARARAAAAKARVETARANLAETRRQHDREKRLLEQQAAARSTVEDLESRVASLSEMVNAASADAASEEANIAQLEVNLSFATIRAPIPGTVVGKPVELGELVGPATPPVAELADFATLQVETDIPESRLSMVKVGSPAEIVLDAFAGKRHRGEVVEISPRINRAKATVVAKVKFIDPATGVLPEMAARVSFLSAPLDVEAMKKPAVRFVPSSAIAERGGKKVVFRIEDGKARITPVKVGEAMGNGFELVDGPGDGSKLVANPSTDLADGALIKEKT